MSTGEEQLEAAAAREHEKQEEQQGKQGGQQEPAAEATEENAQKLFDSGSAALDSCDLESAIEDLAKCLELRVAIHGELAQECAPTYFKYGCALLSKVQAERDIMPEPKEQGVKISEPMEQEQKEQEKEDEAREDDKENQQQDGDEVVDVDEDESDLELAWKMMDIARVIYEKRQSHSIEEVEVITALGDISLEKEDFQTCFEDYDKALEIMRGLVEADDWHLAELYFKISLAQQLAGKAKEALEYCQKAMSVTEIRLENLKAKHASSSDKEKEDSQSQIKDLESLLVDMKEKAEELQQMASAPPLMEILETENPALAQTVKQTFMAIAGISSGDGSSSSSAPPDSTSNGAVTNLGVVGRGIKRTAPIPEAEASPAKRPEPSASPANAESSMNQAVADG